MCVMIMPISPMRSCRMAASCSLTRSCWVLVAVTHRPNAELVCVSDTLSTQGKKAKRQGKEAHAHNATGEVRNKKEWMYIGVMVRVPLLVVRLALASGQSSHRPIRPTAFATPQ